MTSFDNTYSRIVSWAKIVLPLIALTLLSTLFMFSGRNPTGQTIPYSEVEIEDLASDPRITAPNYAGVTTHGTAVSVRANTARPDAQDSRLIRGEELMAHVETQSGLQVDLASDQGVIRNDGRHTTLTGDVQATTSTGYHIQSQELIADMDGILLSTNTPVHAQAPFGVLDAGNMMLHQSDPENPGHVLVFNGGVKLIYTPQIKED